MALDTFTALKTAIQTWLDNTSLSGNVEDFISIAESRLNRILRDQQMETRATLTVGGAPVDSILLPADFLELREIHIETAADKPLSYRSPQFVENIRDQLAGDPVFYSVEKRSLSFAAKAPAAMAFSILYYQKIPGLSAGNPTNWLLEDHPDIYLYASLVQAEGFVVNDARIALWKQLLDESLKELLTVSERARTGGETNARKAVAK